jgi:peptide/nickel transport system ATP-binding protein
VMYAGSVAEAGDTQVVAAHPGHPYTLGLLLAEPPGDRRVDDLVAIPGSVPAAGDVSDQCPFAARCRWATDDCRGARPRAREIAPAHVSACVRLESIAGDMEHVRVEHQAPGVEIEPGEPSGHSVVRVRGLEVTYPPRGRAGEPVRALRGISLDVEPGESVGIVGESGSGKTTLGRCLTGLARATGGSIEIAGIDATDFERLSADERRAVRRTVQMVFQDPYSSLNPSRTVGAALAEALSGRLERKADTKEVAALLERVGLPGDYATRKPVALSGGERQRVAIARAIAFRPALLVCDEPVSALDVSVQAQILNLLRAIRQETQIAYLFITHDLAVVRQIADRVHVLHRGEIVESGATQNVLDAPQHPYTRRLIASIPGAGRPDYNGVSLT